MTIHRTCLAAVLFIGLCSGCVLREEKITISRTGAALIELEIAGPPDEVASGDAMPSTESGWHVTRRTVKNNGKEELSLTATHSVEPDGPMPGSLADPRDPDADLYLEFPTDLRVEHRADGTYYFFHRAYTPRPWAFVQYWHDVFMDDEVRKIGEKPPAELQRDDQRKVIQAIASIEAYRQAELAAVAVRECGLDVPVEVELQARLAMLSVYDGENLLVEESTATAFGEDMLPPVDPTDAEGDPDGLDRLIEACQTVSDERRDACYDAAAARLLHHARDAYAGRLAEAARLSRADIRDFDGCFDRTVKRHEITDALAGHQFETTVVLPGTIIAHNANELDRREDSAQSAAVWRHDGRAFRDRKHELWAVSRVGFDGEAPAKAPGHDDD